MAESGNPFAQALINGLAKSTQADDKQVTFHNAWPLIESHKGVQSLTPPKPAPCPDPKSTTRFTELKTSSKNEPDPAPSHLLSDHCNGRPSSVVHVKSPTSPVIEHTKTQRGKAAIILNGFMFVVRRTYEDCTTWRCHSRNCKAGCKTNSMDELISEPPVHNHETPKSTKRSTELNSNSPHGHFPAPTPPPQELEIRDQEPSHYPTVKNATTKRGKSAIVVEGHMFVADKHYQEYTTWRCHYRSCKSRCKTNKNNELLTSIPEHHHELSPFKTKVNS